MSYIILNPWSPKTYLSINTFQEIDEEFEGKKIELVEENGKYTYNNINFVGNTVKDILEVKYDF